MNQDKLYSWLNLLADAEGVSGGEHAAANLALQLFKEIIPNTKFVGGNVIAEIGERSPNKPHVLLDAHIDQIGMIVTGITPEGFLRVGNVGGLDRRLLLGQPVRVLSEEPLFGVVTSMPPHLTGSERSVPAMDALSVDIGFSEEEAKKRVQLGDFVCFDTKCQHLLGNCVTGQALDDRAGVAALLCTASVICKESLPCSVSFVCSTQEELGERGAQIAAYQIDPDFAIAVDVSFAKTPDDHGDGTGQLGGGPMIGISPSLSPAVTDSLFAVAKIKDIPVQAEVMAGLTSTNADRFGVSRGGACAGTVSIPLRYMHTPVEVVSLKDIEWTALLLAEFLRRISQ